MATKSMMYYGSGPDAQGIVYIAINRLNDKKYIGITHCSLKKRINEHKHSTKYGQKTIFSRAIKKYGISNIEFHKIFECSNYEIAKELEIGLIRLMKPEYNLTKGGEGCLGYKHTPEAIKKMSERAKGNKYNLGRKWTDEQKENMSRICKNKPRRYWLGKKRSKETIEKYTSTMRARGYPRPPQRIIDELIKSAREHAKFKYKKVICLNDGIEHQSITHAAKYYDISKCGISSVCRGKRNSVYGKKFEFVKNGH